MSLNIFSLDFYVLQSPFPQEHHLGGLTMPSGWLHRPCDYGWQSPRDCWMNFTLSEHLNKHTTRELLVQVQVDKRLFIMVIHSLLNV